MSQSEFTARRPDDAAAAKGWEIFLCEQRIESNWRILLTMDVFSPSPLPGASRRKHPEPGKWDCLPKKSYAVAVVMRGESVIEVASFAVPFISFAPGLRMSIEPLNHAPSSIEIL